MPLPHVIIEMNEFTTKWLNIAVGVASSHDVNAPL
jgi:hypothetical protein